MRFQSYLIESKSAIDDYDKLVDLIRKNCKQYIKEVNSGSNNRMFMRDIRGAGADTKSFGYVQDFRSGRKPVDTRQEYHEKLDDFFYKKFKIKGRSETWFVWNKEVSTFNLKATFMRYVFPYNGYKYIWSPVVPDLIIDNKVRWEKWLERYSNTYKKNDALNTIGTRYQEVMLQAPKCVFVSMSNIEDIEKFFTDIGVTGIKVPQ